MKLLTTTFLTSSLALATEILSNSNLDFAYATHLAKYGITYESREEFEERKVEFAKTDELIRQHNESNDVEELTYTLGHNKLSTLSEEERDSMLGLRSISPLDGPIELRGALLGSNKPGSYK